MDEVFKDFSINLEFGLRYWIGFDGRTQAG
eukprot:SAG31_NODE_23087_length_511_cov_3.201456_1_plen_29_part_01